MMFGDVQGLEIVVRRFDLRALDDSKAERKKDALDFLERLPHQMARADRANNTRQREIHAFTGEHSAFRGGGYGLLKLLEALFDVRPELIQMTADDGPQFGRRRLQPLFGDPIQHPGFTPQPGVAQRLPGGLVGYGCCTAVELREQGIEAGGDLRGSRDAQRGQGLSSDIGYFGHASRKRESLHQSVKSSRNRCTEWRIEFAGSP